MKSNHLTTKEWIYLSAAIIQIASFGIQFLPYVNSLVLSTIPYAFYLPTTLLVMSVMTFCIVILSYVSRQRKVVMREMKSDIHELTQHNKELQTKYERKYRRKEHYKTLYTNLLKKNS